MSDRASHATLRIFGPNLDPDEVSRLLELSPTASHRAGDRRSPEVAPYRDGFWGLSSSDAVDSPQLDEHLRYLLERVEPAHARLRQVLAAPDNWGDVFCYVYQDRGHGGPAISADLLAGLAALGVQLDLDIYGPFDDYSGRSGREIRDRGRAILNSALRRPGMYGGQLALMQMLDDLAWADRQERRLAEAGEALVARSMWTATGVVGAFERLVPRMHSQNAAASAFADIAHRIGWLELDLALDAGSYWKAVNAARDLVASRDLDLDEVTAAFGQPSVRIGGSRGGSLGYAGPQRRHRFIWFHTTDHDSRVVCCRREGPETLVESVAFTPLGDSLRDPQPYPTEVLRGVPAPFQPRPPPPVDE